MKRALSPTKRVILGWILPLTLLSLLLGWLGLRQPPEEESSGFSAVVPCEAEGSALLLRSGGETWVVSDGAEEDSQRLARYLEEIGTQEIDLLYHSGDPAASALLQGSLEIRRSLRPGADGDAVLTLGAALCRFGQASDGDLTLQVEHDSEALQFRLDRDSDQVQLSTRYGVEHIDPDRHSLQVILEEDGVSLRPETSAWLD